MARYIDSIIFNDGLEQGSYLKKLPVIKHLSAVKEIPFAPNVTFFVGENGTGKSTLPEAALSPMRLMTLMAEIDRLVKKNSQFIIATHSPILMTLPGAEILEFSQNGIARVGYEETEHYRITRHFLENPEKMLHYLLGEEER